MSILDADGFFDRRALRSLALAEGRRQRYETALPFPHVVIDGFLPEAHAQELARVFPPSDHPGWRRQDHAEQSARLGQLQRTNFAGVAPALRHLLNELNGMAMLDFLETLTGVRGLVGDPHFRGAGLQCTLPGGHLALHVDFERDRARHLARAITVLLYLPVVWDDVWGGALELHPDGPGEVVSIAPRPNRLVVMAHGERAWHGHPAPLRCPEGVRRQAIAAYYYLVDSPAEERDGGGARWRVADPG